MVEWNRIHCQDALKGFEGIEDNSVDCVLLDPPRTGAGGKVIRRLARLRPDTIVYVSCNPTTFAPEARLLLDSGYRLVSFTTHNQPRLPPRLPVSFTVV